MKDEYLIPLLFFGVLFGGFIFGRVFHSELINLIFLVLS